MEITRPEAQPPRTLPQRLGLIAVLAAAVAVLALCGAWSWGRLYSPLPDGAKVVAGDRAEAIVRRVEVAFADAESVWRHEVPDFHPATVAFFTRVTDTPCAGGAAVSGSFYCPDTGTAAFDLMMLDALGERLKRQRDLGLTLVAVRLSAEHLQREAGVLDASALQLIGARRGRRAAIAAALALQADCLTGVWAAAAASRVGPVSRDFWGQLVWSARNVVEDFAREGVHVPSEFDAFAAASQDDRQAAFSQGYAAGIGIAGCPAPVDLAADD